MGFDPGGATDLIGRAFAKEASSLLGVPMPVVNTPGANGVVAAKELIAAKNDGYTTAIMNTSTFDLTPLALGEKERVELDDMDIVKGFTQADNVLCAHAESSWSEVDDLKTTGKRIRYATTGGGTSSQLCAAVTFAMAGIDAVDVPFTGDSPAMTALLGQEVDCAALGLAAAIENIRAGKLKVLAIYAAKPNDLLPGVRTAVDQGYDVVVSVHRTLAAPKGISADVRQRLDDVCARAIKSAGFRKLCADNLLLPTLYSAEEIRTGVARAAVKYKEQTEKYAIRLADS